MIGLHQIPSSHSRILQSQSQSRIYNNPDDNHRQQNARESLVHNQGNPYPDNYEPWTGRHQYAEDDQNRGSHPQLLKNSLPYSQEAESPILGDNTADNDISYFNGQQIPGLYHNETQDRPSIISKSGFANVNDITDMSRAEGPEKDGRYFGHQQEYGGELDVR